MILILLPMKSEFDAAVNALSSCQHVVISEMETRPFPSCQVKTGENQAILAECGIGLSLSAAAAALFAARFRPDAVFLVGLAGALDPALTVGEIVLPTAFVQYDSGLTTKRSRRLVKPGQILVKGQKPDYKMLPSEPFTQLLAQRLAAKGHSYRTGIMISGSEMTFSDESKREAMSLVDDALCIDMESGGIAQVLERLGVPFSSMRIVSERIEAPESPDHLVELMSNLELTTKRVGECAAALLA